jgi:hypothetical protein
LIGAGAIRTQLDANGFAIVPALIERGEAMSIAASCPDHSSGGLRNALAEAPALRRLVNAPNVRLLMTALLPEAPILSRVILFDKSPNANWSLGFHQDVVIAVRERVDVEGFGPWSTKSGVPHVRPPASVLAEMVTLRIHLDDCGPDNGPLQVIPGSHRSGFLDEAAAAEWVRQPAVSCTARAGDAVVMRPLVLHASGKAVAPSHRRIAHFEFAPRPLPLPLRWNSPLNADSPPSSAGHLPQRA